MTSIPASETHLYPLVTDDLIEQRVTDLIGRACRRQLWLLFLDENDVQLPLLMPTDDYPARPEPKKTAELADGIARVMAAAHATQLILVWERYAGADLTALDRAWAQQVHLECTRVGVRVRAQLLSHKRGVRWLSPDDFLA
ncbi:hypothetical protein L1277_001064 [Okibacterium sp. HSC-33S16]|uniref:hypothetical protein n=1 Tax=Okibacterium sp. HSC-33S16 TaxID=2910965 RepID=UPI0020A0FFCE|nr:hypothetical protein [Okibacterium sp. HSC-33S16]MCP2030973.1 hypothetical protein [Okibacterium sp. HSC-33S16]